MPENVREELALTEATAFAKSIQGGWVAAKEL